MDALWTVIEAHDIPSIGQLIRPDVWLASLADQGAAVKRALDDLAKLDKSIKQRIIESAVNGEVRGVHHVARVIEQVRWTLDNAAVKAALGQDWYDQHCKCTHVRSVRYL